MSRNLLILSGVAMLLGAYAAFDWLSGGVSFTGGGAQTAATEAPSSAGSAQAGAAAKLNPLEGLTAESFAAVLERPLFNPGREPRPAEPPPPPPQPEVQPPPEAPQEAPGPNAADYALLAVAGGPSGHVAALRLASTGEVLYLREGQPVGEWSVISVNDRFIVIGTSEKNVTLGLFESNAAGAEAPPVQEAPPPLENLPPPPPPPEVLQQVPESGQ